MTSRRPMIRTYSGNGRTSSFSEEEGSSSNGRSESRNTYLSNVRPENRSTLCSVMAQLTEDIQPSFDTTLKSKAVSVNCNVKFTCVVSGYPAPELKWYKDDMEMDRYCGLPKYEIRRNGKTHTLHIYNCTLDDAAIYQVSACNSKGIVSCSGVLEVGTMNEYQIHQRFFAKLKQKAEKKKSNLEAQAKKEDKENVQKEKPKSSPERPPRKRHIPPPSTTPAVKKSETTEQPESAAEPNRVSSEAKEVVPVIAKDSEPDTEQTLLTKKTKVSNGVDDVVNSSGGGKSHMMGNGGENCYDGGFGLAQFLAEALQSQASEEKQNPPQVEPSKEVDTPMPSAEKEKDNVQEDVKKESKEPQKTQEEVNESQQGQEEEMEKDKERGKQSVKSHTTPNIKYGSEKHHSRNHKDQDHHNIQASISSMLHSVKDFLFGKNKKDFNDQVEKREREVEPDDDATQLSPPEMPPSFQIQQEHHPISNTDTLTDVLPMETDKPEEEPSDILSQVTSSVSAGTEKKEHEASALCTDLPPIQKLPTEGLTKSTGQSVKEADDAVESMEVSAGPGSSCPGEEMPLSRLELLSEVDFEAASVVCESPEANKVSDAFVASQQPYSSAAGDESLNAEDTSVMPQAQTISEDPSSPTPSFVSVAESWSPLDSSLSTSESHSLLTSPTESLQDEDMDRCGLDKKGEPDTEKDHSNSNNQHSGEEKAEVKSAQEQLGTERHEISKIRDSLEQRTESYESRTLNQVPLPVSTLSVDSLNVDTVKEDSPHGSTTQEANEGLSPIVTTASLEEGDLKIQETTSSKVEISQEAQDVSTTVEVQNPVGKEDESKLIDSFASDVLKNVEQKSCSEEREQEAATLEDKETELVNDYSMVEAKEEKNDLVKEELVESKDLLVKANEEVSATVLEQRSRAAQHDNNELKPCLPTENIPIIEISTIEDIPTTKPTEPDVHPADTFMIPKIEIIEHELKECSLPLTILALNKQTRESTVSQGHDVANVSPEPGRNQKIVSACPKLLPAQDDIQAVNVPPAQEVKPAEPSGEKAKGTEGEQERVKTDKRLSQKDFGMIPVINVSCSDDKDDDLHVESQVDTAQNVESPSVPLCLVPLVSVTSLESDPALNTRTLTKPVETDTSAALESGTKIDIGNGTPLNPEKAERNRKQNPEELAEKCVSENKPSPIHKVYAPKVGDNGPLFSKLSGVTTVPEIPKNTLKEAKIETSVSVEDLLRNCPSMERLSSKPPTHPSLSPASLRKFMSRASLESETEAGAAPVARQGEKADDDLSGGSTPTSSLSCESSPRLKRRDSLTLIRSATPEELASGARRKIFMPKPKEDAEGVSGVASDTQGRKDSPYMSPGQARRAALLQATGQKTPPMERRSPLLSRRKVTLEVPKLIEEPPAEDPLSTKREERPAEKKRDPLKAPQVIRKIRGEPFPDASGHLKLWCQFFNVLSDATIKWCKDEEEILQLKRSGGDESQVALAIVLAASEDCGVYSCTISNEYGTDTTDFLLSIDVLSEILLKDDLEVGEEIEMTPLLFTKGLADSGSWGDKYFGRIMTETVHIGEGCCHKTSRVRVIYGLDPIFESGAACIIKVQNPIAYGTKKESNLAERNGEITKQECKVQNMIREYCKIFAAEARLIDNFGQTLEVIPQYLMYRPANAVPYATVEADLQGVYLKYCTMDPKGTLITGTASELEQKSCAFQHWIHQWTHGNLLVTQLEGVETKITNVKVVTKSKGYQGLTECGSPEVFERFLTHHQCNYFCGLLGLKPLKTAESLQAPPRVKGSRSPLLNRKLGSSSPQMQRKGQSPQTQRKANSSPKVTRKTQETEDNKSGSNSKPVQKSDVLEMR